MKLIKDKDDFIVYIIKEGEQDSDYDDMLTVFRSKPDYIEGHEWKLKHPSLEWVSVELSTDDECSAQEILDILLGGGE